MTKRIFIATGIYAPVIGGPASYARTLGTCLAKQGMSVTILTYSPVLSFAQDKESPMTIVRVWTHIPWGLRHIIYGVRAWWHSRHADHILLLNATSAGFVGAFAARFAGKQFIVRIVGDYAWEMAIQAKKTSLLVDDFQRAAKSGRIKRLHRFQVWTCKKAEHIIVPSDYLAGIVRGWGIPADRIIVIPNGVHAVTTIQNKEDARRAVGIPGNIILSAGRLVPWKGYRMLIKIMPQLLDINQFFRLVIVGDGPELAMLRAMVRNLGLERKAYLVGRKTADELAVYFAAADMFVLNTGYEGFSHQILEAMAAGVPIITTPVGGNREVMCQGENGFLVKYNDEFNLIEAIKTLASMPDLKERFIEEGKRTAAKYTVEHMCDQVRKLLS